jgi:hypothetical protein
VLLFVIGIAGSQVVMLTKGFFRQCIAREDTFFLLSVAFTSASCLISTQDPQLDR